MIGAIKTLVVGYGLSAKAFQLPFLHSLESFEVVGIVQPRGNTAQQELPQLQHYKSLEEALLSTDAELVVISAPNEYHAPMAKKALLAGKHVLLEKPFALQVNEARALVALARQEQKVLTVYHNRRWDADFLTLKEILKQNLLGQPVMFVSRFDRFRPQIKAGWKEEDKVGTGVFFDLAPHLVDQALQLWGWPLSVYAHIRQERTEALTPDAFDLYLYYDSLTVHLAAGSLVSASWPRFSLLGTAGSYTKMGIDPQEALLRQGMLPSLSDWGVEAPEAWGTLVVGDNQLSSSDKYPSLAGNYAQLFIALAQAIRRQGPNPVPPDEALKVMEIMALALKSHQEGCRLEAVRQA